MSGSKRRVIDSDSSSDSDDDVPLSKLRADARAGIDITAKPEASSSTSVVKKSDPAPAALPTASASAVRVKSEPNGSSASRTTAPSVKKEAVSDSEDDVPISGLRERKKIKIEVKTSSSAAPRVKSQPLSARTPTRPKKRVIKIKYKQQECTEELYQTLKGRLTQELLCRWWYAMEWPSTKAKEAKLHGVQELDGFRGSYIRVKGDEMGSIVDTRTPIGKPSFLHFFAMPSADIQKLLLKAYEKQIEALIEHEGDDAPMLKDLRSAKASAARIDAGKADRGVAKALKSYKELAEQLREIEERAMKEENTATEEDDEEDDEDEDDE